jgi:beta-lactamase regulating signal transducer with metallopeptidase domain
VGLLRPTAIVSPQLIAVLDRRALAAVRAHEEAHARHRDPLRIWVAQLVTDLQWPSPAAAVRLRRWLEALELARDEEARRAGIAGVDLATAILAAARVSAGRARRSAIAPLGGEAEALAERIGRLLTPLPQVEPVSESRGQLILLGASVVAALVVGALCGETAVHALLVLVA